MEHGSVRLPDGTMLAYQVKGTGTPLLLLPGQANSHRWWDGLRTPFARSFRTITFDYRGTGDTTNSAGDGVWSTSLFAADAVAVLDHLGQQRVRVYGTSMGGRVAQQLAVRHQRRISKLVLACTSPGGALAHERGQSIRRTLADRDPGVRRAALLDLMYTPAWAAAHGHRSTLLGDPAMTPDATRRHLRVSSGHDAYAALPTIAVPTLVLHGSDDLMAPVENAELIARQIPGAGLHITPGGRHGFFDEFAETVTPRVLDFLA